LLGCLLTLAYASKPSTDLFQSIQLSLLDNKDAILFTDTLQKNARWDKVVPLDGATQLIVNLKVAAGPKKSKDIWQQASLLFSNPQTQTFATISLSSKEPLTYAVDRKIQFAKLFGSKSGIYNAAILLGSPQEAQGYRYELGQVSVTFDSLTLPNQGSGYGAIWNDYLQPKPLLAHTFKPQDKTVSPLLTKVFMGLCLAPWLGLLRMWSKLGLNANKLSKLSSLQMLSLTAFIATLALVPVFNWYFWTCWKWFTALTFAGLHASLVLLTGQRALSALASVA